MEDGGGVALGGPFKLVHVAIALGLADVADGLFGLDFDGHVEVLEGLFELLALDPDFASVDVGVEVLGELADGLAQLVLGGGSYNLQGVVHPGELFVGDGEEDVGVALVEGLVLEEESEVFDGLVVLSLGEVADADEIARFCVVAGLEDVLEDLLRLVGLAFAEEAFALEDLVGVDEPAELA